MEENKKTSYDLANHYGGITLITKMNEAVNYFVDAIIHTKEYQTYMIEKDRIKQNSDLKEEVDAYRKKNFEMQSNINITFEEMELFEKEHAELTEQPEVSDFLEAEMAFCRMMQEIHIQITEAIEFD